MPCRNSSSGLPSSAGRGAGSVSAKASLRRLHAYRPRPGRRAENRWSTLPAILRAVFSPRSMPNTRSALTAQPIGPRLCMPAGSTFSVEGIGTVPVPASRAAPFRNWAW